MRQETYEQPAWSVRNPQKWIKERKSNNNHWAGRLVKFL